MRSAHSDVLDALSAGKLEGMDIIEKEAAAIVGGMK